MDSPQPFVVRERVRWADVDYVRIMRFSAFTRLIEMAEQELMREAGLSYAAIFNAPTMMLPRRQLHIEYLAPAALDDELALVTYVSRMGDTSITFNVDVRKPASRTVIATAAMVVVCVGVETFVKQPLPEALRVALAPFSYSVEDAAAWALAAQL